MSRSIFAHSHAHLWTNVAAPIDIPSPLWPLCLAFALLAPKPHHGQLPLGKQGQGINDSVAWSSKVYTF